MTRNKFIDYIEVTEERNWLRKRPFMREFMQLFCVRVNLTDLFDFFIKDENRLVEFDFQASGFKSLNEHYLEFADSRTIPHSLSAPTLKTKGKTSFWKH